MPKLWAPGTGTFEERDLAFLMGLNAGTKGDVKTKFIKGACENCGATTHSKKVGK